MINTNLIEETEPLLRNTSLVDEGPDGAAIGKDVVDFDRIFDSENPQDWPKAYKWGIVALLAFMAFTV